MEKHKNSIAWIDAGYALFAREGLDGIHVERLARILHLNKSGFYHYFGDLEGFCTELLNLHKHRVNVFVEEILQTETLDPDYLELLVRHAETSMFQVQLVRTPNNRMLYEVSEMADEKVVFAIRKLWCDHMGIPHDSNLGIRYLTIVRDMFYTRISFQNHNYNFLHKIVVDAKAVFDEMSHCKSLETDQHVYPQL